jgi:Cu-Zn family superoxide dismutase
MKPLMMIPIAAAAALAACQTVDEAPAGLLGQASLRLADGSPAGTARLLESGTQLNLSISLTNLPEGEHGLRLHITGSCEAPDYASAGGPLEAANTEHGHRNLGAALLADLPKAVIGASGSGTISSTLRGAPRDVAAQMFDADGTALVVHAGPDDRADLADRSNSRIACGIFTRP